MSRHRIALTIVSGAVALSAVGIGGAVAYGAPGKSPAPHTAPAQRSVQATSGSTPATIHASKATVGGKTETILVDAQDFPLYYYELDTAKKSFVTGELAQLWPPLVSASPTETGAHGKLSVSIDTNGKQVAYNGHFLYTFADDSPGHVTGQGVQDFFVATPNLKVVGTFSNPKVMTATSSAGYRY